MKPTQHTQYADIVGGITQECAEIARLFYSQLIDRVIPLSSIKCAQMVKLLENTVAASTSLSSMCHVLGVSVYEVIDGPNQTFRAFSVVSGSGLRRTPAFQWIAIISHGSSRRSVFGSFDRLAAEVNA